MPYLLLAFAIGCVIPLQAAVNAQLRGHVGGSTVLASLVSFGVGTVALALVAAFQEASFKPLAGVAQASPWLLTGGLMGALFVFATTLLAPKIGVARMLSLIVAGQLVVSLAMDRYGWLGLAVREATPTRLAGAALVALGVLLVNWEQMTASR